MLPKQFTVPSCPEAPQKRLHLIMIHHARYEGITSSMMDLPLSTRVTTKSLSEVLQCGSKIYTCAASQHLNA